MSMIAKWLNSLLAHSCWLIADQRLQRIFAHSNTLLMTLLHPHVSVPAFRAP